MAPLETLKNMGNAVVRAGKDALRSRETRTRSPGFQAEMAREMSEWKSVRDKLGNNTFNAGVAILLKTPTRLLSNALRTIYDKKYGAKAYGKDAFKLFFDQNGVVHHASKVAANALHFAGKSAKVGVRKLFAV